MTWWGYQHHERAPLDDSHGARGATIRAVCGVDNDHLDGKERMREHGRIAPWAARNHCGEAEAWRKTEQGRGAEEDIRPPRYWRSTVLGCGVVLGMRWIKANCRSGDAWPPWIWSKENKWGIFFYGNKRGMLRWRERTPRYSDLLQQMRLGV
jgi:hypothetical protein